MNKTIFFAIAALAPLAFACTSPVGSGPEITADTSGAASGQAPTYLPDRAARLDDGTNATEARQFVGLNKTQAPFPYIACALPDGTTVVCDGSRNITAGYNGVIDDTTGNKCAGARDNWVPALTGFCTTGARCEAIRADGAYLVGVCE